MGNVKWENADKAVEEVTEVLKTQPPQVCFEHVSLALEQYPDTAELHSIAGVSFLLQEDLEAARGYFAQAAKLAPRELRYLVNHAEVLSQLGEPDKALTIFQEVLNHDPRYETAYIGIGNIHQERNNLDLAAAEFARAVRFNPASIAARNNYAVALVKLENYEDALEQTQIIIQAQPDHNTSQKRMAKLLALLLRFDEAIIHLTKALEYHPDDVFLLHEIGKAYDHCHQPELAIQYLEKAAQLNPDQTNITLNLSKALHDAGRIEDAIECLTPAAHNHPQNNAIWSNLLMLHHYMNKISRDERFKLHQAWGSLLEANTPARVLPKPSLTDADKPLRIGLVSADLREHPVGYFLLPLLKNIQEDLSFFAYHNTPHCDGLTKQIQDLCTGWQNIQDLLDEEVADIIERDQIDILIDLSGHTSGNRLSLFAIKPAPIQATGLGYVDTTGLSRMDYIISDKHQSPKSEDHLHTEKVWRMPADYIVYSPPAKSPDISQLPAKANGYLTFGSCNKPAKLGNETIALWSKTLNAIADSKLILRNIGLDNPSIQNGLIEKFEAHNISPDRITFLGGTAHFEFLATYNQIDIALDPTPYSGGLTTLEAIWMGVPVITNGGPNFASRHSVTHLRNSGLEQWVAKGDDDFIGLATYWSNHIDELCELRKNLREQLGSADACNGKRYAREFSDFIRQIWQSYVNGEVV